MVRNAGKKATAPVEKSSYDADTDPVVSYQRKLTVDREFYDRVIATKSNGRRRLVYEDLLEPHSGNAFPVEEGQVIRIEQRPSLHNGRTQIADVLFITPDLEQISDHLNSTALEGFHPRVYGAIWTQRQFTEKIATLIADEFPYDLLEHDRVNHIFWGPHCNPEWIMLAHGSDFVGHNSCYENFTEGFNKIPAIQAIEDAEERRATVRILVDHNDINIFQPNEIKPREDGVAQGVLYPAPQVPDGTGIEWYAERDLFAVMSNCPYADQARPLPEAQPNPLYVSVYETGIVPEHANPLELMKGTEWEDAIYENIKRRK